MFSVHLRKQFHSNTHFFGPVNIVKILVVNLNTEICEKQHRHYMVNKHTRKRPLEQPHKKCFNTHCLNTIFTDTQYVGTFMQIISEDTTAKL